MRNIVITTESGNDLPEHLIKENNIHIAPMYITMDGTAYADRSIPVQKVYDYYKSTSKVPTTSAVNIHDFETIFREIREKDPDSVIFHLAYSAVTTCSYQNAVIASEGMDDVYIVDCKNVSGGATAYIVKALELIRKRQTGLDESPESYKELAAELSELAGKIHFSFLPGNLNFLKAGGRVSNAAFLGAMLLRIKPLIEIKDGNLVVTKKYRGSTEKLVKKFMEDFVTENNISREALYIVTTEGISEAAIKLLHETADELGFKHHEINPCGLVITCHSGPGSMGIGGWEVS